MNNNDYKDELEHRLLGYYDMIYKLRPSHYKDPDDFERKLNGIRTAIESIERQLKIVEQRIKDEKAGKNVRPTIV